MYFHTKSRYIEYEIMQMKGVELGKGSFTDITLLELSSQMSFDKSCLSYTSISNKDELKLRDAHDKSKNRSKRWSTTNN